MALASLATCKQVLVKKTTGIKIGAGVPSWLETSDMPRWTSRDIAAQFQVADKVKLEISTLAKASKATQQKIIKTWLADTHQQPIDAWQQLQSWQNTFVVIVPVNCTENITYQVLPWSTIWFVVDAKSTITIIEKRDKVKSFGSATYILSGANSNVDYAVLGQLKNNQGYYKAYPGIDSTIQFFALLKNQGHAIATYAIGHHQSGSQGNLIGTFDLNGVGHSDIRLINNHIGQKTTGDIAIKLLGRDRASATATGWITIGPVARETNSFLREDVLLLSKQADIKAIPNLEIAQCDVKASHSATIGRLDPMALYYLMARGLSAEQSQVLLVDGFFASIYKRITNPIIRKYMSVG